MKKFLLAMGSIALAFALTACDDSASSNSDASSTSNNQNNAASSNNGTGANTSNAKKGSFPENGDPNFYCIVTHGEEPDGKIWSEKKFNIPNRQGHVERLTFDADGNGTQYYEDSYYNLNNRNKVAMCMEFNEAVKEKSNKKNFIETYCEGQVSYFIIAFENAPLDELISRTNSFAEDCKWEEKNWEDSQNRQKEDDLYD
ncbi:putative lipoprotein [Fibrobacter succinogenes subsp. succinogenes S85]|jgi:hypothetical protein|uniref:Putative lipoprotein n=1 Tax=Fibrobacter succinogenes (strain ATCC 19169 / S85) TaxID=59374 RepID=C9RM91_FIBSS|nr:hypothetical protein [Fibrobacter succinogenes]ACX74253.1 hypothetical protein Fisuc_0641 [Fibrobacter succinogenes subsp. succinogenes S85]ADL24705.1 putative lipoprotein [Fibrobacter succinogenes subsp. succinogenes S85]